MGTAIATQGEKPLDKYRYLEIDASKTLQIPANFSKTISPQGLHELPVKYCIAFSTNQSFEVLNMRE